MALYENSHRIPRRRRKIHSQQSIKIANAYAHPAPRKRGPASAAINPRTAPPDTPGARGNHSRDAFTTTSADPPRAVAS